MDDITSGVVSALAIETMPEVRMPSVPTGPTKRCKLGVSLNGTLSPVLNTGYALFKPGSRSGESHN